MSELNAAIKAIVEEAVGPLRIAVSELQADAMQFGVSRLCSTSQPMDDPDKLKTYLLDEDTLAKLQELHRALDGGTDRERDFGHKLWLLCIEIRQNEVTNI